MEIYKADIITMEQENKTAKYLITENEKILYVGKNLPEKYKNLPVNNLEDKTIVPGFFDTHTHFSSFGFFLDTLPVFINARSIEEISDNLSNYIKNNKKKFYIMFGISPFSVKEKRLPLKKELDKITDKPLFIVQYDGHGAIANSALLKKMKIPPLDGFDEEKGHFFRDSFYQIVKKVTFKAPLTEAIKGIKKGMDYAASQGITSIVALQGEGFFLDIDLKLVKYYSKRSKIQIIPYFQTRNIKKFKRSKLKTWGGCFECAIDGSFGSLDAALNEPYCIDTNIEGNKGKLFYPKEDIEKMLSFAQKKDIQIAIHAIGDRAVKEVISSFKNFTKGTNQNNHRIEHALILSKEDIDIIAKEKIHIATQPAFLNDPLEPIEFLKEILGEKRFKRFMPLKEMFDAGIEVSGGSDAPVTMPSPVKGIHAAVNHPNKEQRLTPYQALEMFTVNGAKGVRVFNNQGSIKKNKLADFVVLSNNPLKVNAKEIKNIKVLQVFKNGKKVF